jgi:hypothetical protein
LRFVNTLNLTIGRLAVEVSRVLLRRRRRSRRASGEKKRRSAQTIAIMAARATITSTLELAGFTINQLAQPRRL